MYRGVNLTSERGSQLPTGNAAIVLMSGLTLDLPVCVLPDVIPRGVAITTGLGKAPHKVKCGFEGAGVHMPGIGVIEYSQYSVFMKTIAMRQKNSSYIVGYIAQ